jgi:hypothetical protein
MSDSDDKKFGFTDGTLVDIDGETLNDDDDPEPTRSLEVPASLLDDPGATRALDIPGAGGEQQRTMLLESPSSPPPPKGVLVAVEGPETGKRFEIHNSAVLVGRSLDCDIVLGDQSVSRRHFRIEETAEGLRLIDLGSGNGTQVDGERVTSVLLVPGSRIFAGMSVLEVELPGRGAKAPAPRPVRSGGTAALPRPAPIPAAPAPAAQADDDGDVDAGGSWAIVGVVVFVLAAAATWFVGERFMGWWNLAGLGQEAPAPEATASVPPPVPPGSAEPGGGAEVPALAPPGDAEAADVALAAVPDAGTAAEPGAGTLEDTGAARRAEAVNLFEQGKAAALELRWADALASFEAVRAADPTFEGLDAAIATAKAEVDNARKLHESRTLIEAGSYQQAIDLLQTIPTTSSPYAEAQEALKDATSGLTDSLLEQVRQATRDKDLSTAKALLTKALALDPTRKETVDLDAAANKGMNALYERVTGESLEKPARPVAARAKTDDALAAYKRGDFAQAKSSLDAELSRNLSPDEANKVRKLVRALDTFEDNYAPGKAAASAGQFSKATQLLEKAHKADKDLGGAYKRELGKILADAYAERAAEYYAKGADYGSAAVYASKALTFDASHENARGVYEKCQGKGEALFSQAMKDYGSNNKVLAASLFRQVIKILPSTHASYKEAHAKLKEIQGN